MIYSEESPDTFFKDMEALIPTYEEELPLTYKIAPDWTQYRALYEAGVMFNLTARKDGKLVGYFVVMVSPNLSCLGEKMMFGASLFVLKEWRGKGPGIRLIRMAEKKAKDYNCQTVMISSPSRKPIDGLLRKMGYHAEETLFSRRM